LFLSLHLRLAPQNLITSWSLNGCHSPAPGWNNKFERSLSHQSTSSYFIGRVNYLLSTSSLFFIADLIPINFETRCCVESNFLKINLFLFLTNLILVVTLESFYINCTLGLYLVTRSRLVSKLILGAKDIVTCPCTTISLCLIKKEISSKMLLN